MLNTLLKKTVETFNKPTPDAPEVPSPAPKADPKPMDSSPRGLAAAAAEAAGFIPGDQYQGLTARNKPANARLLWASVDGWGDPVLYSVQNSADWSVSERIWGHYAGPDAEGRLVFENRDGVRRNKFGRRR